MLKSLITEYGLSWTVSRSLYGLKLKMLKSCPVTELFFEKQVNIKHIDIFDINVYSISAFLRELPEDKKKMIIKTADDACEGKILCFSSFILNFGNPINWHLNPITGVVCRADLKWYTIPDFDGIRGDIKIIWEASRFTHFYALTRAFMLTNDCKYYNAFSNQLGIWLKDNNYSFGVNFKCGQECAFRLINVLMTYSVFYNFKLTSKADEINIKKIVSQCYRKILSNFFYTHKCIKNNHTLSELCGIIIGSWCCEDHKTTEKAFRFFEKEINNQFFKDGGYKQYSFNYQRLALQIAECVITISGKTKERFSAESRKRLESSVLLMYQCQNTDGDLPNYGSNDGSLIFPVTVCGYRNFKPVINTIYVLLSGKRLYDYGEYDEELLWFSNNIPEKKEYIECKTISFSEAGLYTLRHHDGFIMICSNDYTSRPAHMDQLHVDLWHKGVNILCDTGTYSYADDIGKEFILTGSHNTVKIYNVEQMNKYGHFMMYNWSKRTNIKHNDDSFDGTMVSHNGYIHNRSIAMSDNGYQIRDQVSHCGLKWDCLYHTPCQVEKADNRIILTNNNNVLCHIESDGFIEVIPCKQSLYYMKTDDIKCIHIKYNSNDYECITKIVFWSK